MTEEKQKSIVYCYLDDARREIDRRMREWSMGSLRYYCGDVDVDVVTLTMNGLYANPLDGETIVDAADEVDDIDGICGPGFDPAARMPCSAFPNILFVKLLAPLMRRFGGYERIVVLDSDIEVVSPDFKQIETLAFPEDVDVMAVRHGGYMCPRNLLTPGCDKYLRGGFLLFRPLSGEAAVEYRSRVRHGMELYREHHLAFCEESIMNIALRRAEIPYRFNPTGVHFDGTEYSHHYAGNTAKNVAMGPWKQRFDTVYSAK